MLVALNPADTALTLEAMSDEEVIADVMVVVVVILLFGGLLWCAGGAQPRRHGPATGSNERRGSDCWCDGGEWIELGAFALVVRFLWCAGGAQPR